MHSHYKFNNESILTILNHSFNHPKSTVMGCLLSQNKHSEEKQLLDSQEISLVVPLFNNNLFNKMFYEIAFQQVILYIYIFKNILLLL